MNEFIGFLAKNPLLSAGLIGVIVAWLMWEIGQLRRGFLAISPQQLVIWMNRKNARVIDLASNNEFLKQHIDGAVNVPMADFTVEHKVLKGETARPVAIYDRNGLSASAIAKKLKSAGFAEVAILDGGLDAWLAERLPCVKGR